MRGWMVLAFGCAGTTGGEGDDSDGPGRETGGDADADADADSDADSDAEPPAGSDLVFGDSESFTPKTWSYNPDDYPITISVTDLEGLVACGLGEDVSIEPGRAASQLLVQFRPNVYDGDRCPEGLFPLTACDGSSESYADCAMYRRWNQSGELVVQLDAAGGAMRVSRSPSLCSFELEATFDGTNMNTVFEIPFGNGSGPFCTE